MNVVSKLPIELVRKVYGFGYSEFRDLYADVLREMAFRLKWGKSMQLNETDESFFEKSVKEIAYQLRWASFCRCCERHVSNRTYERMPRKFAINECPCHCRQIIRAARFIQVYHKLQPHQRIGHYLRRFEYAPDFLFDSI